MIMPHHITHMNICQQRAAPGTFVIFEVFGSYRLNLHTVQNHTVDQ